MREALAEARKAFEKEEVPVGAVVVSEGEIIGRGHNLRESLQDPAAHAEMIAIGEASRRIGSFRLVDADVYVTLEPCLMCAGLMLNARVKRLFFGCRDPKAGAISSLYSVLDDARLNHRVEVAEGLLAEESSALLKLFFERLRGAGF
ncbi:MAG: nucleoside deaminase [Deltaproteobacteria bacterium]|nr:nucleoside deaminase [Deltaproteobacteria bacterium]